MNDLEFITLIHLLRSPETLETVSRAINPIAEHPGDRANADAEADRAISAILHIIEGSFE